MPPRPQPALGDLQRPWHPGDPRSDRATHPYTDRDSAHVLDQAVTSLILLRAPMWLGDAGPAISVLASLAAEADRQLFDAVADAIGQDYSWTQIAGRLATSVATARRRYAGYVRWRSHHHDDDEQPWP